MKTTNIIKRNIFGLLLLAISLGWMSCSAELPAPKEGEGQDLVLSVGFTSDEMETKAATDTDIQNRFIAAFQGGNCTGIAYDSNNSALKIKAKTGDVAFIAIANANTIPAIAAIISDHTSNPSQLPTYAALKAISASVANASGFNASSLIKMTEETKTGLTIADSEKETTFTLSQLPAKVNVSIKVERETESFRPTSFRVKGINRTSDIILAPTDEVTNTKAEYTADYETAGGINADNSFSFYTYERATSEAAPVWIEVTGIFTKEGVSSEKSYLLKINPRKEADKVNSTTGIVHGWAYDVTGTINGTNIQVTVSVVKWGEQAVEDVEFGGSNSNNNNKNKKD